MAAARLLYYYVPIRVYYSLAICTYPIIYDPLHYCLGQWMITLVYSWLKRSTIKTVLWLVKASYLVFAFVYQLLPRAPY